MCTSRAGATAEDSVGICIQLESLRSVGWLRSDVDAWVGRQIARSRGLKKDCHEASNEDAAETAGAEENPLSRAG